MDSSINGTDRKYIDPDAPEEEHIADTEVEVSGKYDDNPTGGE